MLVVEAGTVALCSAGAYPVPAVLGVAPQAAIVQRNHDASHKQK